MPYNDRLKIEIEDLSKERDRYQKKLEKNSVYQKYMEKVQETSDEFSEIREIIARYDTLVATHLVSRSFVCSWLLYDVNRG